VTEILKYGSETSLIIGCAMKVHTFFGKGFKEIIYQRSLQIDLIEQGLDCRCEVQKDVIYHGNLVGIKRLDMIVERKILVELKVLPFLDRASVQQVVNYLKVFDLEVGLLLNFGSDSLQIKRIVR
jgi:GxxExxY protein